MKAKEYTCIFCGAKGVDRSTTGDRKFCSKNCAAKHWRRVHSVRHESTGCLFNEGVACDNHSRCLSCGWNPEVDSLRKERYYERTKN